MTKSKTAVGFFVVLLSLLFFAAIPNQASAEWDLDFEFEFLEKWSKTEKDGNEKVSTVTANLSLLFLLIAITYPLCRFIMKSSNTREGEIRKKLSSFMSPHIIAAIIAFFFTLIHYYYAEATSVFLALSTILMVGLIVVGSLMRYVPNLDITQRETLMSSKLFFFWGFLFLVILGHILVMD